MSFSEMLEVLGVSNSFLTYHLENLGELVGKTDDGRYKLSSFGEAAMSTMTKVEDIPTTALYQSPQTKPKRLIRRSIAMALGIICILLIASMGGVLVYYTVIINKKENELGSANKMISQLNTNVTDLQNQDKQLQTWLDGNETLLNQTQANNTNLQNQIDLLNSNATNLQNQVNNFHVGSTTNSTILFDNEIVHTNGSIPLDKNASHVWIEDVGMAVMTPTVGYLSIRVSSNNNSTYVVFGNIYISNSTNLNVTVFGPINQYLVGLGGTIVFPVSAASTTEIYFESSIGEATLTVTITYYY
jgi:hypothetical protein